VATHARALGIPLEQPQNINDPQSVELIAQALGASAAAPASSGVAVDSSRRTVVVCAFGALIKEPLLSAHELLNVHPSLLPRWRGAAPIERAIMAGDTQTGVSIMRLTAGLDSGPVCLAAAEPIRPDDDFGSLSARLRELAGELLVRALDQSPPFQEQADVGVSYAEKIGPADRLLDPARAAAELERVVRALHPHVGARVALADGTLLGVHRAALAETTAVCDRAVSEDATGAGAAASQSAETSALTVRDGRLLLDCADGTLELLVVQPPGARAMDAAAYLRGHTPFGGADGLPGRC
jgi:methionyl-tRNA formyltransferase